MGQFDFTSDITAPIKLTDHSDRHENEGADEISLTGLSGDPADTINESLLTTQNDIIVRGASIAERLNITEQTLAGRLTGGNVSAVALGISDNNIAQIDGTSNAPANLDYAKFTTSGLEGRSYQELVNDISGVIKATDVEVSELSTATYDDAQDYINFFGDRTLLSGGGISARADALTGVNTGGAGSASFEISGDLTATYKEDDIITVNGSTANDGNYTLKADSTHAGGTTTITVDEAVSDGTVDGSIYGAANVASGTAWAKATDSDTAVGKFFNFSADNTVTLTNLITNYIYLDYNTGTPQMAVSTSIVTLGFKQDHIHIATIFRNGNTLHYHEEDALGIGRINIADMRLLEMHDADRASGLITTDAASLALNVSAGVIYEGLNRHTIDAQIPASWSTWYTSDSGSTWTEVTGQSTIDNAQYNDVTSGLEDLTSNRYAVHWLYVDIDGANLFIVYGRDNYTINGAEEAGVPASLPDIAVHYGVLIAKIIVQKDDTTLEILYPWTTTFHSAKATDHGNLAGLGGDDHIQYFLLAGETTDANLYSGADLIVYSDAGSTEKARIDGATGNITTAGTVDGVDIAGHASDVDAHATGCAAGELLVGTGVSTAAWQSTGVTLTAPILDGTVTNTGAALVMPAFTAGGDIIGQATYDVGSAASPIAEAYIGNTNDYLKVAIVGNLPTLYGTGGYLRVGDGGTLGLTSEDDLLVTGHCAALGVIYSGGGMQNNAATGAVATFDFLENGTARVTIRADYNKEQYIWGLSSHIGMQMLLVNNSYRTADFGITPQTNPTLLIYSATNPATDATQYVVIYHDQTDGNIDCAKGTLNLGATGNVNFAGASMGGGTVTHDDYVELEVGGVVKKFMTGS